MRRRIYAGVCVVLAVASLGGLYWGLGTPGEEQTAGAAHSQIYYLSISTPGPGEELPIFKPTQGDTVTLLIHSDRPGELHVHAYEEQKIALKPGGEVRLTFTAQEAGRFAVHLHDRDGTMHALAFLEVQPK